MTLIDSALSPPFLRLRLWASWLLLGAGWLPAIPAAAQRSVTQGPVVVLEFAGPGAEPARDAVLDSLANANLDLFPLASAERVAADLGADLAWESGRQAVAEQTEIMAYVGGEIRRRGSRFRVSLFVYSGHDGSQVGLATIRARRGRMVRNLQRGAFQRLRGPLRRAQVPQQRAAPPAPAPPAQARAPQRPPAPARRDQARAAVRADRGRPARGRARAADRADRGRPAQGRGGRPALGRARAADQQALTAYDDELPPGMAARREPEPEGVGSAEDAPAGGVRTPLLMGVGMSFIARTLRYNDQVRALADHSIDPNPALLLQLRFYPIAFVSRGFAGNIGIDFRYSYLLFATSRRGNDEFDTEASDLRLGLHLRLPLGAHDVGFGVAYGAQSMGFSPADDDVPPEYAYDFLRFGGDARLVFGAFAIEPQVALLLPLSYGEVGSAVWFPNTSGLGLDLGLQLGVALGGGVELFGGAAFRQWGLSFNPEPDDVGVVMYQRAAGGATDRYLTFDLGVAYRF